MIKLSVFMAAFLAAVAAALYLYLRAREWNEEMAGEDPLGSDSGCDRPDGNLRPDADREILC